MPEYLPLGLIEEDRTPDELVQPAFDYMTTSVVGWLPTEGNQSARLLEAVALMVYEAYVLIGRVPSAIFRYFGRSILELNSIDATSASVNATVTVISTAGWTIPAGTRFGLRAAGDQLIAFSNPAALTIAPGSTVSATGAMALLAVEPGVQGSGLSGPVEFIDAVGTYVVSVVPVGVTTGGIDAESDSTYQERLRDELTTLAPRVILPVDAEIRARRIAGVDVAVAIDNLNPANGTTNNERMLAVAVRDVTGELVSTLVKTEVDADLQSKREVNFIINVIDPTYTSVRAVFTAVAYRGFDVSVVRAAAIAALTEFLSPAAWGRPQFGDVASWVNTPTVRLNDVIALLDGVDGVNYVSSLTINGAATDLALTGYVPLPRPALALAAPPVANTPTTATSGGTLAAGAKFYKVTALNATGETAGSNEVTITTTGTTSTVTVTWSPVTSATGYRVYRGTTTGGQSVYFAPGNVLTFTDTGAAGTAGTVPAADTGTGITGTVTAP